MTLPEIEAAIDALHVAHRDLLRAVDSVADETWEHLYNTFRPHQALAGQTPKEYLAKCHPEAAPVDALSHM